MRARVFFRITFALTLALAVLAPVARAQTKGTRLPLFDRAEITLPPGWKPGSTTKTSVEVFVPLSAETSKQAERREPPKAPDETGGKENPKPEVVVSADAGMLITIERRRDHAEALRRLAEIASERSETAETEVIDGWPAIERRFRAPMPQPGETESTAGDLVTWFSTTAVVLGDDLIRFDTMLAPEANPELLDQALAIGRSLRAPGGNAEAARRELEKIPRPAARPPAASARLSEPVTARPTTPRPADGAAGTAVQVQPGLGELEVATSDDGAHVVVAANSGFSFSDDFGAHWTFGGGTPCNQALCDGDPSLAAGQSGAIYYSWIGGPSLTQLGDGVSRSTDDGHTFPFQAMAVTCPGASSCQVADQEHIAADRDNAGALGDRVYDVWRNFPVAGAFSIRIVCSQDGGSNWGTQAVIGSGDFPRVRVGGNGFVYVSWASGGNMMLHKLSDCDAGLAPQPGFPVVASTFTNVVCPVPGLDRCNGRNILSSPVVAVDDLDPSHVYYAFATSTGAGNEDVMVFDSTDGGMTFPRSVRVNGAVAGRRFMPWISTYGGVAVVSWYDRRHATAGNDDLTRFFVGSAAVKGGSLVAGTEVDLSGNDDPECMLWPCATNATTDSESCSVQPRLAGRCSTSGTPCDFSTPGCPLGETCDIGRGCPKFGDYNGNAARAGRHYSAWASATAPVGAGSPPAGINVYTSTDLVPSDVFVRDWTTDATTHDGGQQPSTNPAFWATSDVWNQSTSTAAPFPASDWIPGDAPSRSGSNFAFARVSRRAPAAATAPPAMVTVEFLTADFGLGSMFTSAGTENVAFGPGDLTQVTPGHSWPVSPTASSHLCIAAQITAPEDDFDPPSLVTTAPGPADPLILLDNNKAQRNLADTVGAGGTAGFTEMWAIVRNAAREPRPMEIGVRWPRDVRVQGRVSILGGKAVDLARVQEPRLPLGTLRPGEVRWLRFQVLPEEKRPVTVDFFDTELVGKAPNNGFSIQFARAPVEVVAARNTRALGDVFLRLATLERSPIASREAKAALAAAEEGRIAVRDYLAFLDKHRRAIEALVGRHLQAGRKRDPFAVGEALRTLSAALAHEDPEAASAAENALTERLDAHLTSLFGAGAKAPYPARSGGTGRTPGVPR